jgi:shikimate dehydrogenase
VKLMNQVRGTTKILGVMGSPVTHSFSPVMHNAAIAALGLDYVYVPFPVAIADLTTVVKGLKAVGSVEGFNLTIPHKQEIIPLLDRISDTARAIGAVNTVKRSGDEWVGTNTDVAGFLVPLLKLGRSWHQHAAVVLGCGGAAKAVVAACLQLGFYVIHVVGRDRQKLDRFKSEVTAHLHDLNLCIHEWSDLSSVLEVAGIVINTTPIGMTSNMANNSDTPISSTQMQLIPAGAIAYDLIYTPRPTQFLKLAAARGLIAIDGLEMLLHQGAIALEFWVGRQAPIEIMHQALLSALDIK